MTEKEYRLNLLAEECNEVAQRVSKILRFGIEEIEPGQNLTNEERLAFELLDLGVVIEMLLERDILRDSKISHIYESIEFGQKKRDKIETFIKYSKHLGTII